MYFSVWNLQQFSDCLSIFSIFPTAFKLYILSAQTFNTSLYKLTKTWAKL